MEIKHYTNIRVLDDNIAEAFKPGDEIVIQEKIDGANFSIRYDSETDTVKGFSRRNEITAKVGLKRAHKFIQGLNKNLYKSVLGDNLIIFLEWLNPHIVNYQNGSYHKPFAFDVFDISIGRYINQAKAMEIADKLGLTYVPTFYTGPFISWDHVKSFVGKTVFGTTTGEGVVVKNQTNTHGVYSQSNNYTKIVCKDFSEKNYIKQVDTEKLEELAKSEAIANAIVTEARVKKILCKLVDEGILREDWDSSDIPVIYKSLPREVYMDCMKEEPELVNEAGKSFGSFANKMVKNIVSSLVK